MGSAGVSESYRFEKFHLGFKELLNETPLNISDKLHGRCTDWNARM
jgi:hypothetical protein